MPVTANRPYWVQLTFNPADHPEQFQSDCAGRETRTRYGSFTVADSRELFPDRDFLDCVYNDLLNAEAECLRLDISHLSPDASAVMPRLQQRLRRPPTAARRPGQRNPARRQTAPAPGPGLGRRRRAAQPVRSVLLRLPEGHSRRHPGAGGSRRAGPAGRDYSGRPGKARMRLTPNPPPEAKAVMPFPAPKPENHPIVQTLQVLTSPKAPPARLPGSPGAFRTGPGISPGRPGSGQAVCFPAERSPGSGPGRCCHAAGRPVAAGPAVPAERRDQSHDCLAADLQLCRPGSGVPAGAVGGRLSAACALCRIRLTGKSGSFRRPATADSRPNKTLRRPWPRPWP